VSLRSLGIDVFDYSAWPDPPLLFRKDEFLPADHSQKPLFDRLSRQMERAGILPAAEDRFTKAKWSEFLQRSGYSLKGHRLLSLPGTSHENKGDL